MSERSALTGASFVPEAWRGPEPLRQPLERFVFAPHTWVRPRSLARHLGAPFPAAWGTANADAAGVRRVMARALPPRRLDTSLLARDLRGRLALLPRTDWLRLGLCISVLPFCGQIQRSMDGHFRRVVREALGETALRDLDQYGAQAERPIFLAGAGAWRAPAALAAGGVRSALEQACGWPDPVRKRFALQFEPEELEAPPSVGGLDMTWLEIACKASWPDHPWLWC